MKKQLLLVGVIAFSISVSVVLHDIRTILSQFMNDDSFFYLEIARNVAHGKGFTFDGLHETNGFQPLFLFLLIPIYWLPIELEAAIYVEKFLEAILFTGSAVLLFGLGKKFTKKVLGGWITVAVLFLPTAQFQPLGKGLFNGMESGLNALLLLCVLHYWINTSNSEPSRFFFVTYGILIGALFLARLDNVFIIAGIFFWHIFNQIKEKQPIYSGYVLSAAITTGIALIYLLWNTFDFGMFTPISGQVKYWYSNQRTEELFIEGFPAWLMNTFWFFFKKKAVAFLPLGGLVAIPAILLFNRYLKIRKHKESFLEPKTESIFLVLWVTSVIKIFYYAIFQQFPHNTNFWYYIQELVVISISISLVGNYFLQKLSSPIQVAVLKTSLSIIFLVSWAGILTARPIFDWEIASYNAVSQIKNQVELDAIIASDDAGVLGYFLPNPVINLDGLVNNAEYFNHLKSGTVREYILKNEIDYLANLAEPTPEDLLTEYMREENLELIYQSDQPLPSFNNWVYKLYRVIK